MLEAWTPWDHRLDVVGVHSAIESQKKARGRSTTEDGLDLVDCLNLFLSLSYVRMVFRLKPQFGRLKPLWGA